jgi:hypothetical protein
LLVDAITHHISHPTAPILVIYHYPSNLPTPARLIRPSLIG